MINIFQKDKNHYKYYKIAEFLAGYGYELFNIYNINEARSGQIRWGDAIYTRKKLGQGMVRVWDWCWKRLVVDSFGKLVLINVK